MTPRIQSFTLILILILIAFSEAAQAFPPPPAKMAKVHVLVQAVKPEGIIVNLMEPTGSAPAYGSASVGGGSKPSTGYISWIPGNKSVVLTGMDSSQVAVGQQFEVKAWPIAIITIQGTQLERWHVYR